MKWLQLKNKKYFNFLLIYILTSKNTFILQWINLFLKLMNSKRNEFVNFKNVISTTFYIVKCSVSFLFAEISIGTIVLFAIQW